ncbi:PREDICTED: atherin-like isoform X2 [Chinchilla lanigera]|uniref:atherin-like isoform X2 n=1 Tax=Chinchilla lanigera TaxID=34839 RepID=UPI000698E0B3|nr:PREDICTED: atherin-like isoform X2 [Chinchilla lanigera]
MGWGRLRPPACRCGPSPAEVPPGPRSSPPPPPVPVPPSGPPGALSAACRAGRAFPASARRSLQHGPALRKTRGVRVPSASPRRGSPLPSRPGRVSSGMVRWRKPKPSAC